MEILHSEYKSLTIDIDLADSIYSGVHVLTARIFKVAEFSDVPYFRSTFDGILRLDKILYVL